MDMFLPPIQDARQLELEMRVAPRALREDALQEAWVAYLSGRDPARAANTFCCRERRLRTHERLESDVEGHVDGIE